ncbi:hypothetical protein MMC13_004078 [Lambiella insularis]|nr:hypothetical protein [Lambiella insularis]
MAQNQGNKQPAASQDRDILLTSKQGISSRSSRSSTIGASPHSDHRGHTSHQALPTHHVDRQTAMSPALTHHRLAEHDHNYAHVYSANDMNHAAHAAHAAIMTQAASQRAKVTVAGRSLGIDLSQPVYDETMRRYDGMTPAKRFLVEKDRVEYVRAAAGQYTNGFRRK